MQTPTNDELRTLAGKKLPLPDFLALFGTRVRNDQIALGINQALRGVGLTTLPDFTHCGSRADIHLLAIEADEPVVPEEESEETDDDLTRGALPTQSFRIADVPAANNGVDSILPNTPLTEATYHMRAKNYSQLAVLENGSTLRGVVSWESISLMYELGKSSTLANAMIDDPPVAEAHQDFFSLLPMVSEHGYLLVRGGNGHFSGIVTASDITERFEATAWPFFMVGEIEYRLRKCLGARLDPDNIRAVQWKNKQTGLITDLMFNGYVKLLHTGQQDPALCAKAAENWTELGWAVSRNQFVYQLDRVRDIRNRIAHFDPEPLPPQYAEELRQFVRLLRQLT
ncbi:CBS domain-containing protein [Streptomyces sp. P38-E01]|uniref:CBS domain-containing protein n=1 Tax=Streptomyces tardus TaxID=2780544 RepID=A0A949JLK8_9ACTN|nr:CBS domain-containing protein [Streptomyces tardus]MBU7596395.1 CBS domain-containing protein [Streptomyces tardus]